MNRDKELIADINGDSFPDLVVVVGETPNRIDVFYRGCGAHLSAPETVFLSSPQSLIYDLTTGDVNNDGRVDLILERYEGYAVALAKAEGGTDPKATVYYGSASGDFSAGPILDWSAHVNEAASEIRAGDFNRGVCMARPHQPI